MTLDWQTMITLAVVAAAIVYLVRVASQNMASRKAACGGCRHCAADERSDPSVVQIESLMPAGQPGPLVQSSRDQAR